MLNALWIGFFLIAFGAAILQYLGGDASVFAAVMKAAFDAVVKSWPTSWQPRPTARRSPMTALSLTTPGVSGRPRARTRRIPAARP